MQPIHPILCSICIWLCMLTSKFVSFMNCLCICSLLNLSHLCIAYVHMLTSKIVSFLHMQYKFQFCSLRTRYTIPLKILSHLYITSNISTVHIMYMLLYSCAVSLVLPCSVAFRNRFLNIFFFVWDLKIAYSTYYT